MPASILVTNLSYNYPSNNKKSLDSISFSVPTGSRIIIVGPNGAGKSTLLKFLSGQKLHSSNSIIKLSDDMDPFNNQNNNEIAFVGTDWILNSVIRRDMPVSTLVSSVGVDQFPERRDKLIEILDIDLSWNMNEISDGQRRRVQLLIKIYGYWKFLFLDEVTVDLDVLVRLRLLNWIKNETETRDCSVVYATHILDGLASLRFPTHFMHLRDGKIDRFVDARTEIDFNKVVSEAKYNNIEELLRSKKNISELHFENENNGMKKIKIDAVHSVHPLALNWLMEDFKVAKED